MTPKFKRGDKVRIPQVNRGHDNHDPAQVFTVQLVWTKPSEALPSYSLSNSPSVWPEGRLVHA